MSRLLVVTSLSLAAVLDRLKADGHELPEGTELVTVDPQDPEWRSKVDAMLADGSISSFHKLPTADPAPEQPCQDEHMEETPDRKLSAQLSPRQAILPPHLRQRRL